ncbi:hypothetical protein LUZ60_012694 [Juncus effusus]|nr:hypothetical protein LUZ60_012694 [Juncus effusus]
MMGIRKGSNNNNNNKGRVRLLVTVTVYGSAGPIRFLVNEGEMAAAVVRTALKTYARQGRLPVLGSHHDEFVLYHAHGGSDALEPEEQISFDGSRNFLLCKKEREETSEEKSMSTNSSVGKKRIPKSISWKSGLNRLLSFRI